MTQGSKSITLDTYDQDTLGYLRAFPQIGDALMRRVEDALLRGARLDLELVQAVRARNSAMRQWDEERAGKEGNIVALNAAIARAVTAEDAVTRVKALHRPDGGSGGPGAMCVSCSPDFGTEAEDPVPWPCATIRALDA